MKQAEFITLMALLMSLVALAIDMMLPALPNIATDMALTDINHAQYVISTLFAGMLAGSIIFGPLADSWGRKPTIIAGLVLYIVGAAIAYFASDFTALLLGRAIQGTGASAVRLVLRALIRDQYSGRLMAKITSYIMTIFILVPVIAPALGQLVLNVAHWRTIFLVFMLVGLFALIWFSLRQAETLDPSNRRPLAFKPLIAAVVEVVTTKDAFAYALATGLIFGGFIAYLMSSQQIFDLIYGRGPEFPYYFGTFALIFGIAAFVNAQLVMKFGMQHLSILALIGTISIASIALVLELWSDAPLGFISFLLFGAVTFFFTGILFGNLNAMAMEPLGHIAGMGAAVVGMTTTLISVPIGTFVGQLIDADVLPLIMGFLMTNLLALACMIWATHHSVDDHPIDTSSTTTT